MYGGAGSLGNRGNGEFSGDWYSIKRELLKGCSWLMKSLQPGRHGTLYLLPQHLLSNILEPKLELSHFHKCLRTSFFAMPLDLFFVNVLKTTSPFLPGNCIKPRQKEANERWKETKLLIQFGQKSCRKKIVNWFGHFPNGSLNPLLILTRKELAFSDEITFKRHVFTKPKKGVLAETLMMIPVWKEKPLWVVGQNWQWASKTRESAPYSWEDFWRQDCR